MKSRRTQKRVTFTVNGDRYRAILNEFLFTNIEEEDIGNIGFQQATSPKAEATFDVWRPVFEDRIISHITDVDTDAVKDKCYADKPETIVALKDNIRMLKYFCF